MCIHLLLFYWHFHLTQSRHFFSALLFLVEVLVSALFVLSRSRRFWNLFYWVWIAIDEFWTRERETSEIFISVFLLKTTAKMSQFYEEKKMSDLNTLRLLRVHCPAPDQCEWSDVMWMGPGAAAVPFTFLTDRTCHIRRAKHTRDSAEFIQLETRTLIMELKSFQFSQRHLIREYLCDVRRSAKANREKRNNARQNEK